ncbi:hypothetical protein Tco_1197433, partial [Tanacetum coccineum]
DVDLGTNGGTSNLASNKANSGGSSSWNVEASSTNTTPDKYEKLIIEGKVFLADDEGKPLKQEGGFWPNSLLEQWRDTYRNIDYDYAPYDDDMHEGQEIPDKIQSICDNLNITGQGHKKK